MNPTEFHYNAAEHAANECFFGPSLLHYNKILRFATPYNRIILLVKQASVFRINNCLEMAIICLEKALSEVENIKSSSDAQNIKNVVQKELDFSKNSIGKTIVGSIFEPKILIIEPTNYCNYKCPKCLNPKMKRSRGNIDIDKFKNFLGKWLHICGEFEEIIFTGAGEPLCNNEFPAIVEVASKIMPDSRLTVGSNLALFTKEVGEKLIANGLRSWEVSLDSIDEQEYRAFTGGGDVNVVIKNLEILSNILQKTPNGYLEIAIHRVFDEKYSEMISRIAGLFGRKCSKIRSAPLTTLMGRNDLKGLDFWEKTIEKNKAPDGMCADIFKTMVVTYTGEIRRCCSDMFDCPKEEILGNAFEDSWANILMSKKRQDIQMSFIKKEIDNLWICNKCPYLFSNCSPLLQLNEGYRV